MHLFLPLAFLLIHGCSGLNLPNAVDVTTDAVNIMNKFRQQVAGGTVLIDNYLNLPTSQSIFQLKPSAVLNSTARLNILNCNAKSDNISAGHSISIFTTSHLPSSENSTTVLHFVLKSWKNEPTSYGVDRVTDIITYNNAHLKDFANMVYYKSTEVGCYYNKCNTAGQATHAVACVFNMLPQMNKPLYIRSQGAQGCNSDESCSEQLAGSTCITSGTYAGLCDPGEKTFAGTPLNMTVAVRKHIIGMHNYRRSRLAQGLVPNGTTGKKLPAGTDIAQLNYNKGLERAAQAYANNCPAGLSSEASRPGTGEIYQSLPSNKLAIMDAISLALKASWHPVWIVGFNDTLEFVQSLEEKPNAPIMFTQMAWGKTQKVGCGAARCSRNTTVICRYSPSGNIVGQKLYTPGKTCSNCPNGCTKAYLYKGLCID